MHTDFSIIIPVYNVSKYLEECMNSILDALKESDEIILVCGNSTDDSKELAWQYGRKYKNVKVIEPSGEGPSNARNAGLKIAEGIYILFVDGDDFVDSTVLCKFLNEIRSGKYVADILITDFYAYKQALGMKVRRRQFGEQPIQGVGNIIDALSPRVCFWNIWRYVYRRDFLLNNKIQFWEDAYAEDLDFTIRIFLSQPEILFVPIAYYHYRMGREGSLMNRTPVTRVLSTLSVLAYDIDLLQTCNANYKQKLIDALQFEYILNLALICEISKSEQRQALAIVREEVLKNSGDQFVRIMHGMIRVSGVRFVANILSQLKRIKRKKEKRSL